MLHKHNKISMRALKMLEMPGENPLTRTAVEVEGRYLAMTPFRSQSSLCSHGTAPSFTTLVPDAPFREFSQRDLGHELAHSHGLGASPSAGESQDYAPFPGTDIPSDISPPQRWWGRGQTRTSASTTGVEVALRAFNCGVGKEALNSFLAHRPRIPLSDKS